MNSQSVSMDFSNTFSVVTKKKSQSELSAENVTVNLYPMPLEKLHLTCKYMQNKS